MSCSINNIELCPNVTGETWPGITIAITSSDDTKYASTLSRVRMSWKSSAGTVALTLDSNTVGHITIDSATAYAWGVTVEPRALSLTPDTYSWAIETTDGASVVDKDWFSGTHQIIADPHS